MRTPSPPHPNVQTFRHTDLNSAPPSSGFAASGLGSMMRPPTIRQARVRARMTRLGLLLIAAMIVVDYVGLHLGPFREGPPDLEWTGLWRCVAYAVGMAAIVIAASGASPSRYARTGPAPHLFWPDSAFDRAGIVFALAVPFASVLLLSLSPQLYDACSVEDGIVEWPSAVLPLMGSVVTLALVWRLRDGREVGAPAVVALALYALTCFAIAGEEVSWLQRVIGFHTPTALEPLNMQGEFNLHNVATNHVENAYYFSTGFVLFVVLPLWRAAGLPWGRLQPLAVLAPGLNLVPIGAMIVSYNFDMWNGALTQIAFWGSIAAIAAYADLAGRGSSARPWWLLVGAMLAVQAALLWLGGESAREWDHTEYKELLISWGLWVYAVDLASRRRA